MITTSGIYIYRQQYISLSRNKHVCYFYEPTGRNVRYNPKTRQFRHVRERDVAGQPDTFYVKI